MGGFLSTTQQFSLSDDYNSNWQKATVDITVSATGVVSWTVTMTNSTNTSGKGKAVSLYLKIADKELFHNYYDYSSSSDSSWKTFPTGHNTSKSGSFTLTNTAATTLSVALKVCCMQYAKIGDNEGRFKTLDKTITRNTWTDNRLSTPTIANNGNNTFTVTPGRVTLSGTDPVKSIWSYYKIVNPNDGSIITDWTLEAYKKDSASLDPYTISLPVEKIPGNKVHVIANTQVIVTYGGTTIGSTAHCISDSDNRDIDCYRAPTNPGVPALTTGSFRNGRLTIKQNWQYIWTPATARGASGIAGYRIRIYKSGISIKGLTYSNGIISKGTGTADYVDTESDNNSITFDPASLGFIPGNTVEISIFAYSKNGKNQTFWSTSTDSYNLFSGGGYTSVYSDTTPVQNTGIMRIKLANTGNAATDWKEGQVLVKVSNTGDLATDWKEADEIKIKTTNSTDGWATAE